MQHTRSSDAHEVCDTQEEVQRARRQFRENKPLENDTKVHLQMEDRKRFELRREVSLTHTHTTVWAMIERRAVRERMLKHLPH